jgi:hypothetical protein
MTVFGGSVQSISDGALRGLMAGRAPRRSAHEDGTIGSNQRFRGRLARGPAEEV